MTDTMTIKKGDVVEVDLPHRSEPATGIVLATNGEGAFFLDLIGEPNADDLPVFCTLNEVIDIRVFDPAEAIKAA